MPGNAARSSLKNYLDATVFFEPRSFSRDDFFAFMLRNRKCLPDGALGILEELAASDNYLLGALNNEARETNEFRFANFGLRNYFQGCVQLLLPGTAQAGCRRSIRRALDILGRPAERILVYRRSGRECGRRAAARECKRFGLKARKLCDRIWRSWEFCNGSALEDLCNWD